MFNQPLRRWLAICCLTLLTTACGGGGGSGGSNEGSTSGTTTSAPSSSPSTSPSTPTTLSRNVRLSWTIPTTRADGSALGVGEIASYRLFYTRDGSSSNEDQIVVISSGSATTTDISLALAGTYTFAITALDLNGTESSLSSPVSITVN